MKKLVTSVGVVGVGIMCLLALDSKVDDRAKKGDAAPAPLALDPKGGGQVKKEDAVSAASLIPKAVSPANIAIVFTSKLSEYYKAKEANESCAKAIDGVQKELLSMGTEYEKLLKEYMDLLEKSKNPALTEEAKKKAKEEAEKLGETLKIKEIAMRDFKAGSEGRIVKLVSDTKAEIIQTIKQKVSEVAKAKGTTLVLEGDGPFVWFTEGAFDITEDVLTALNADRPKVDSAQTDAAKAPVTAPAPVKK
jgi:Skp family chaperone for outer membrane proteins